MEVPSKKLLAEVKLEINEDEARKRQSLEHFREWIEKHPFLKNIRQDDIYLLQFLRAKKYSMDEAFKVFENHFLFRHSHPTWFAMTEKDAQRLKTFVKTGIGYVLTKRDVTTGSYIAVFNGEHFDLERFSHQDLFHSLFASLVNNLELEDNQILGYSCILNLSNTPAKFFTSLPVVDLIDSMKILEKCPGRYKKLVVYGLPSFAVAVFNIAKNCLSEKQRSRLHLVRGNEELHKIFDKSILIERFGGPEKEIDVMNFNFKNLANGLSAMRRTNDFEIDVVRAAACGRITDSVGSFRKLEID